MSNPYIRRILAELWPSLEDNIWAILDCARDERICYAVEQAGLDQCCLFTDRIPQEFKLVAPHLVKLDPGHRFTRRVLDEGWNAHWGVFLQAKMDLNKLRLHLKQFLRVRDEQGHRLYFRFYDPRVLRVYLPTCTPEELQVFYGPITRFIMAGEDPSSLMEFSLQETKLKERHIGLAGVS
jgi:hypothetical protein